MLGLLDPCHAFVVFYRFRQRGRSRVTDVVAGETARNAMNTQKERFKGIELDQKRGCARIGEREREEKEEWRWKEGGRDGLNAWLTRSFSRFCCVSALPPALSLQCHQCCSG